jgi:spermidine synthase
VIGDGRLELAEAPDASYDAIVLDAFSSDSIPVHLLTTDAVELYLDKVRDGGIVVFHVSNQYLELEPVAAGIAKHHGLTGVVRRHRVTPRERAAGLTDSHWIAVARERSSLGSLPEARGWVPLPSGDGLPVWTDESSNVLDVISWLR